MQKIIAKSLLLLMLITVFGQVMAQPCADMHTQMMTSSTEMMGDHRMEDGGDEHDAHCGDGMAMAAELQSHCGEAPSAADDCGQSCTCCPGHCASVLPTTELGSNAVPPAFAINTYRDITSSPNPESAIKPPRVG
ncbi:hypothetical protein SAMN04487965_1564 [Microbulbifer donghaiensis]|uniref:Uncharacterized protein n=1 Tax=Microbulbifer donghaiensis TaxID=494016 RepID=A0A1M4ZJE5_9GAMM|nr:hypothetical protein [Microbulbifer donghaiensis]SHF18144.1 hypothetical protein SAMN04487965_1564 [Microbulbifer donghaiensis]